MLKTWRVDFLCIGYREVSSVHSCTHPYWLHNDYSGHLCCGERGWEGQLQLWAGKQVQTTFLNYTYWGNNYREIIFLNAVITKVRYTAYVPKGKWNSATHLNSVTQAIYSLSSNEWLDAFTRWSISITWQLKCAVRSTEKLELSNEHECFCDLNLIKQCWYSQQHWQTQEILCHERSC